MTKSNDLERVDILDRVICSGCVATSRAMFVPGFYFCSHSKVFLSVSKPASHRKAVLLVEVEPADLGLVLIDNFGEDGDRDDWGGLLQ